jgi:hypothetical protein
MRGVNHAVRIPPVSRVDIADLPVSAWTTLCVLMAKASRAVKLRNLLGLEIATGRQNTIDRVGRCIRAERGRKFYDRAAGLHGCDKVKLSQIRTVKRSLRGAFCSTACSPATSKEQVGSPSIDTLLRLAAGSAEFVSSDTNTAEPNCEPD